MVRLPNIVGDVWFNSKPLTREALTNKVVLVDFWTYSCINCQRTLPYLKKWWGIYKSKDFLLIGIHSPEFEFEKDPKNIETAIKELGVSWPVVLDNDHKNWNAFANHYWPAKYLTNRKGQIVYTHFGEGAYADTEREIQRLLKKEKQDMFLPSIYKDEHEHGKVCFIPTPETYCGYERGRLHSQEYHEEKEFQYQKPHELPLHSIALDGRFYTSGEYVESRETGALLLLHFLATEVNLVMARANSDRAVVEVKFNDQILESDIKGNDVSDASEVIITQSTLYNLIKGSELLDGILTIRAAKNNFQAFAFTFSGCQE